MIKWFWTAVLLALVCAQNETKSEVKVAPKEIAKNSTTENVKSEQQHEIEKKNLPKLPVLSTLPVSKGAADPNDSSSADDLPGSAHNPIQPQQYIGSIDDNSMFNNIYVFITVGSLSVVAVIVFKTHRMKQSRAELKYGQAIDEQEKMPFPVNESSKRWALDESSDDEDKLFDINFLKNARTNAAHV